MRAIESLAVTPSSAEVRKAHGVFDRLGKDIRMQLLASLVAMVAMGKADSAAADSMEPLTSETCFGQFTSEQERLEKTDYFGLSPDATCDEINRAWHEKQIERRNNYAPKSGGANNFSAGAPRRMRMGHKK